MLGSIVGPIETKAGGVENEKKKIVHMLKFYFDSLRFTDCPVSDDEQHS